MRCAVSVAGAVHQHALCGCLVLAFWQLGLSYALYAEAIKHVPALEAMLIPMIEPGIESRSGDARAGERQGPGRCWCCARPRRSARARNSNGSRPRNQTALA